MDFKNAFSHLIGEDELKSLSLNMPADSGACIMAINKTIQSQLEITLVEKERFKCQITVYRNTMWQVLVFIRFASGKATCNTSVSPGDSKPLIRCYTNGENRCADVII